MNLTDNAWQWLAAVAKKAGVSRNDYLEALAESNNPFMEMVEPFMEVAESEYSPLMEMAQPEIETDEVNIIQQRDSKDSPLMEMVQVGSESFKQDLEEAHADYVNVLESISDLTNELRQEVQELRSQLEKERVDREEIEAQLSDLKQKSATASELPEAADLLNQLKTRRKKSNVTLADVEALLEMIEG